MSEFKHTPGPWWINAGGSWVHDKKVWFDSDGARCGDTPNIAIYSSSVPDAHLIAAAPDLLAALESLVNLCDGVADGGHGIANDDWKIARAAIAKAKGGSQ